MNKKKIVSLLSLLMPSALFAFAAPWLYAVGKEIAQFVLIATYLALTNFEKEKMPELYTIVPSSKKEGSSSRLQTQETNQAVTYDINTQHLLQQAAKGNYRHIEAYIEELKKDGAIPASGIFSWDQALEKSNASEPQPLATQANTEAIVAYLNKPVIKIEASNSVQVVPHAYFESFRPASIANSINFSFTVDGIQIRRTFDPNNRVYCNISGQTADRYVVSPRQELISQINTIMRDPKRAQQLLQETAQLQALFPRFYVQGASNFQALQELSNPAHFQQLKSIKHYREQLNLLTRRLQNIFLHKDGRYKSGWQVGCEKQISYALAYFYLLPEDHLLYDLANIVKEFHVKKVPGADLVLNDLVIQSQKGIVQSIADAIMSFGDYVDGSRALPDLTTKMEKSQLNKDVSHLIELCNRHDWREAKALVSRYEQAFLENTGNAAARNDYYVTCACFEEKSKSSEVFRRYASDPLFNAIHTSGSAFSQHLQAFEKRREVKNYILKMINVKKPSRAVETLCYELVPHFFDPKAIAECLSFLSSDHHDMQVRELYHTFHDSNGICKILAYDPQALQSLSIPTTIGEAKNRDARKALNVLVKIDTTDERIRQEVYKGLQYVVHSCTDDRLRCAYSGLADAIVAGEIWNDKDKTLLACDDFSSLNQTKLHEELRSGIVLAAAKITQLIGQNNQKKQKELGFGLIALSSLSQMGKININRAPEFFSKYIAPKLEAVNRIHSSFEPYTSYLAKVTKNINRANSSGNNQVKAIETQQTVVTPDQSASGGPEPNDPEDEENKKREVPKWEDKELVRNVDVSQGKIIKAFVILGRMCNHMFHEDHIKDGLYRFLDKIYPVKQAAELFLDKLIAIVQKAHELDLLKHGSNQIQTTINGKVLIIRIYIDHNGVVQSFNCFAETTARQLGNCITI